MTKRRNYYKGKIARFGVCAWNKFWHKYEVKFYFEDGQTLNIPHGVMFYNKERDLLMYPAIGDVVLIGWNYPDYDVFEILEEGNGEVIYYQNIEELKSEIQK